jgi:ABC-type transport system substrate-binding protein
VILPLWRCVVCRRKGRTTIRVSIDPTEQRRAYRDYAKLQAEELPALPLFFPVQAWVFRDGVTGLKLNANHRAPMWNAREWDIRR